MMSIFFPFFSLSSTKGIEMPPKLLPPPWHPMTTSGYRPRFAERRLRLLPDHGLVQEHVVEHRAEGVLGARVAHRLLDRLADRDAERAGVVRLVLEHLAADPRLRGRAREDLRPVALHHDLAVGLLVVGCPHHEDLDIDPEVHAREGERAAPLARARLGDEVLHALHLVGVRLGHRGVRLVAARRRHALVLEEDHGGRAERLLEELRPDERCRPVHREDLQHLVGDRDLALLRHLLLEQAVREQRLHGLRGNGLAVRRVQHRRDRLGKRRQDVQPVLRDLAGGKLEDTVVHGRLLCVPCTRVVSRPHGTRRRRRFSPNKKTRAVPGSPEKTKTAGGSSSGFRGGTACGLLGVQLTSGRPRIPPRCPPPPVEAQAVRRVQVHRDAIHTRSVRPCQAEKSRHAAGCGAA